MRADLQVLITSTIESTRNVYSTEIAGLRDELLKSSRTLKDDITKLGLVYQQAGEAHNQLKAKVEEVHTKDGRVQARIVAIEEELAKLRAEHSQQHADLSSVQQSVASGAGTGLSTGGGKNGHTDKTTLPDKYRPSPGEVQVWRDWSYRVRNHLSESIDAQVADIMEKVEGSKEEVTEERLKTLGFTTAWDRRLRSFLTGRTEGAAFQLMRGGRKKPALELWRLLAEAGDPSTAGCDFHEIGLIMHGKRCADYKSLPIFKRGSRRWRSTRQRRTVYFLTQCESMHCSGFVLRRWTTPFPLCCRYTPHTLL